MEMRRQKLSGILHSLCDHVYFQPPESVKLVYPCIIYSRDNITPLEADNLKYAMYYRYTITVIDKNPDSKIVSKIANLPKCSYSRHYTSDNLNHDVFSIYI